MGATKEIFARLRESDFNQLPNEVRGLFTYIELREENEYETHKSDSHYLALKKAERKAKEQTQKYLFDLRHNKK
jgi:hypothetical protein